MNLHLLRLFHAVAENGSFSRAAEACFISQPAVSKGVRELEHQLGLTLLERNPAGGKGLRLTDSGLALRQHADAIFAMERAAARDMRERVQLMRGQLVLGASTTVSAYWLPPLIAAYARQHPTIIPELIAGNTQHIGEAILQCRIDLGVVEGPLDDERIESTAWRQEPLRIVAAAAHDLAGERRKASVRALSEQTWLVRESGSGTADASRHLLAEHGITPARCIAIGSNAGIARCVAEGMGVALLPLAVSDELIATGRLVTVATAFDKQLERTLYWLTLRQRPRSPATQAFVDLLLIAAGKNIAAKRSRSR